MDNSNKSDGSAQSTDAGNIIEPGKAFDDQQAEKYIDQLLQEYSLLNTLGDEHEAYANARGQAQHAASSHDDAFHTTLQAAKALNNDMLFSVFGDLVERGHIDTIFRNQRKISTFVDDHLSKSIAGRQAQHPAGSPDKAISNAAVETGGTITVIEALRTLRDTVVTPAEAGPASSSNPRRKRTRRGRRGRGVESVSGNPPGREEKVQVASGSGKIEATESIPKQLNSNSADISPSLTPQQQARRANFENSLALHGALLGGEPQPPQPPTVVPSTSAVTTSYSPEPAELLPRPTSAFAAFRAPGTPRADTPVGVPHRPRSR